MKKNVIIFDLDGTLLNTLEDLTDSTNFALQTLGYRERTLDEVRNFVGNGVAKLIERAIPHGLENPDYENCLKVFKENYSENMYNKTAPYDGILPLLKELRGLGYKIAVVSNKFDKAVKALCQQYFGELVDVAIGEDEKHGIKKKPSPDTVNKVLELFCANSDFSVYVGDSDVDILTAKNSNMSCISVTWGFRDEKFLKEHGAELIVHKPEQMISVLEKFNKPIE